MLTHFSSLHTATDSPARARSDLALILASILLAWVISRFWLYPLLALPSDVPLILRPSLGFLCAWALLRRRNQSLHHVGLARPSSWPLAALTAVTLYALQRASESVITPWLAARFPPTPRAQHYFASLHHNLPLTLTWIAIGIAVGAFCEELLFRGALMHLIPRAFRDQRGAVLIAALSQALLFGALHAWGGALRVIAATLYALCAATVLLVSRQGLWPLIVVHAVLNTTSFWKIYTG